MIVLLNFAKTSKAMEKQNIEEKIQLSDNVLSSADENA